MRYLIFLLFILPFTIYSQKDVEILNDSFLIISSDKANNIKQRTENLKAQIEILSKYVIVADTAIKKSINRELWYDKEISKWAEMDSIMREKLILSRSIIGKYETMVAITEVKLKDSEKNLKKEKFWKNVYKPVALGAVLFIGLNLLIK